MGFHHFLHLLWSLSNHTVAADDDEGEGPNWPDQRRSPRIVQVKDARCHNKQEALDNFCVWDVGGGWGV